MPLKKLPTVKTLKNATNPHTYWAHMKVLICALTLKVFVSSGHISLDSIPPTRISAKTA